jgi:hypothetical protein
MKRRIGIGTTLVLALALLALAAGPNLSGTWVRDKDKSDPMGMGFGGRGGGGGGGRPGGGGGGQGGPQEVTLVLKQTDNELSLTRKASMGGQERPAVEAKFTLDGKESVNSMPGRGGQTTQVKSKAKWNKDKLVIESVRNVSTPNGDFEITTKDEYSLSSDGKVLTVTTTTTTPQSDNTAKQVYNKQ